MLNTIKFDGREWNVLKDCGDFVVANIGDEVRNITKEQPKAKAKKDDGKDD